MNRINFAFALLFATCACGVCISESPNVNIVAPINREPERFDPIEGLIQDALSAGEMAGAVVVVASKEDILYASAFGDRQVEPAREAMTLDTVFDLASLTKPVATATSIMILVDRGLLKINEPVKTYLPAFGINGKAEVTVEQLLRHTSGLIPDNALKDYQSGLDKAWENICELELLSKPGEKFAYSDVNFIVLGRLVEVLSGVTLDKFATENILKPLGLKKTMFNPVEDVALSAATTEKRDGVWLKGQVHDPRAALMNGVAGHAGLFSTASDLVTYGQMLLGKGKRNDVRILSEEVFDSMRSPQSPKPTVANDAKESSPSTPSKSSRALGWDHRSAYSSNRGAHLSESAFGHGGFTGTVLWIDPTKDRIFIFLSTRLHPDGKGTINPLAGKIADIIGQ
ncbi:MAG: serine hydrolase [Planctomycetota bacterium]|nr:serine hydrolase [Planctomycetota bacterium]